MAKSSSRATSPSVASAPPDREPSAAPSRRWTEAQLRGIEATGHSLLVSAAAGSGKTAMLAARCVHLVCEASEPCDVDELLVVTFTESAAAEMKSRIHEALRARAHAHPSPKLERQLAMMDRASVSTLHSFCARLLREHFHAVGLDPAFSVLDGDEASLLRREVARELFDDRYELDSTGYFQTFIDAYGEGDDARSIRWVIQTYEMLRSLVDPQGWIDRSRSRIASASGGPLEASDMGQELVRVLAREVAATRVLCEQAMVTVRSLQNFPKYLEMLTEWLSIVRFWEQTLATDGIDALAEVVQVDLPKLPSVPNSTPGKLQAKAAMDAVREAMTRSKWRDLLRFTSAQWQEGLRATLPHAEVFLGLVEEFGRRYRMAKDSSRVLDFSDLEQFALEVLREGPPSQRKPSSAARAYHARYKHVLVDEYQDINEVQDAIIALLSRECLCDDRPELGNLFCVGDVKQSIYRFRLAEAARFLDRQKLFRAPAEPRRGEVIDLQANFRSRGPLLQAINAVFERLMSESAVDIEYDHSHRLLPGLDYPAGDGETCFSGSPIEMHLLPDDLSPDEGEAPAEGAEESELDRSEREAVLVAQRIRQITGLDGSPPMCVSERDASGALQSRPIRFSDIVILLRSIRYKSEQYADVLRRAGIPVHSQSGTGYFDSTEVRDMLALLSILDNQRQDIPLATVLRSPLTQLPRPEDCLARVRLAYPASDVSAIPFHDAVVRYAAEKSDAIAARLGAFLARLQAWRALAYQRPLAELIRTVYEETGYLAFCAGLHDGEQRVANLIDLHERASHFGSFHRQSLSRFMTFLESLRDEADLGQPSIASESQNVVRVMSVHRSKGLEFPVVVLPDLGKRINLASCQGPILTDRTTGLGMSVVDPQRMIRYPSLAWVLVQRRLRQQSLAEELRVLYVAMTRAREHLVLVGTCKAGASAAWSAQWSGHAGCFPAEMILGASCLLEWLGPTAAATGGEGDEVIRIQQHSAQEVASWQASHSKRMVLSPQQEMLARLQPLDPAPALDAAGRAIIERLEFRYPFEAFARMPAAQAVTRRQSPGPTPLELPRPRFLSERVLSPADIGTSMHLALAHLDFAALSHAPDLDAQLQAMVERRQITPAQAAAIDRPAILWLLQSEVGELLKQNAPKLLREVPVHAAMAVGDAPSPDPQDRIMIRGRIDALVPTPRGVVLIDYKTDRLSAADVPRRAAQYIEQMSHYRSAIETITQSPLAGVCLVFLSPRVIFKA